MNESSITVVVPVWNGRRWIAPLLATLRGQTLAPAQILVVDNGSTDGAAEEAARGGARVLAMGHNAGFAPAVNRGLREARTPWVAVVNNDVTLEAEYFARLLEAARATGAWFATGKIFRAAQPDLLDGTWDAVCRGGCAWRAGCGRRDGPPFAARRFIPSAPWTAALFRAELFDQTGMLEESFQSYLEDIEFGLRCAVGGFYGVYEPSAVAWHQGGGTRGPWHPDTVRHMARNQVWVVALHFPRRWTWPVVIAQLLWGLVAARHGRLWPWLRGKVEGLRGARRIPRAGSRPALAWLLAAGDHEIRSLQRATGYDLYWRLYLFFTGGGAN
jgi:GT2 family glycosyltransferase